MSMDQFNPKETPNYLTNFRYKRDDQLGAHLTHAAKHVKIAIIIFVTKSLTRHNVLSVTKS